MQCTAEIRRWKAQEGTGAGRWEQSRQERGEETGDRRDREGQTERDRQRGGHTEARRQRGTDREEDTKRQGQERGAERGEEIRRARRKTDGEGGRDLLASGRPLGSGPPRVVHGHLPRCLVCHGECVRGDEQRGCCYWCTWPTWNGPAGSSGSQLKLS